MNTWVTGIVLLCAALLAQASEQDVLAREIYAELIGMDTTHSTGSTTVAAEAMARRLRDAGLAGDAIEVIGPTATRGNLLAHLRVTAALARCCCWRISMSSRPPPGNGASLLSS
ncbi:MAG: hypothetical protein IPI75_03455 [Gammaproteobacteria bacterium]|nr:hypothetical protein [Gammaproteobacteria bacterium]